MGKSKGKRGGVKRLGMEVDVAENVTGTDLTAKDKLVRVIKVLMLVPCGAPSLKQI